MDQTTNKKDQLKISKKAAAKNFNEALFEGDLILERTDDLEKSLLESPELTVYFLIYRDKLLYFKDKSKKHCKGVLFFDDPPRIQWILNNDPQAKSNPTITGIKFLGEPKTLSIDFPIENSGGFFIEFKEVIHRNYFVTPFMDFYKPIKRIGKGSFALVYLFEEKLTGKKFAVKTFNKETNFSKKDGKESIMNEIKIMRNLNHKSIVNLLEVYETENSIYMVMELIQEGQLFSILNKNKKFPMNITKHVLKQILEGVNHIHEHNIMHRDIKPQNILLRDKAKYEVCIVDFGLATKCDEERFLFVRCGTPGYVAPEIMNIRDNSTARYDEKCDIFSIGIIFHIMLLGYSPFDSHSPREIFKLNRKCKLDLKANEYKVLPPVDLLSKMLEKDPEVRISAEEALFHEFFTAEDDIIASQEILSGESIGKIVLKEGTFDMLRKADYFSTGSSPKNCGILPRHQRVKSMEDRDEIKETLFEDSCASFVHRSSLFTGNTDTVTSIHEKFSPFSRRTPESLMGSPVQSMASNVKFGHLIKKKNTYKPFDDSSETRIAEEDEMINSMNKSLPKRSIIMIKSKLKDNI